MKYIKFLSLSVLLISFGSCKTNSQNPVNKSESVESVQNEAEKTINNKIGRVEKTPEEWKQLLTDQEFYVLRDKGTERPRTGDLWDFKGKGIYTCAGCNLPLFESETKYKSGTGWPSFYQPIEESHIKEETDHLLGYARTEVMCARCGGHLGHVFEDGPKPTGLRYCINSVSLNFEKKE